MLTDYTKCVFLDADTLVVQNCDELFQVSLGKQAEDRRQFFMALMDVLGSGHSGTVH